jgi:hypothetical protein
MDEQICACKKRFQTVILLFGNHFPLMRHYRIKGRILRIGNKQVLKRLGVIGGTTYVTVIFKSKPQTQQRMVQIFGG